MTNPYLIQALYGPKPMTTHDPDMKASVLNDDSGNRPLPTTADEQSLIEILYGNNTVESHPSPNLTHPERQQLIKAEDTFDDEEISRVERPHPCMLKGSNALPLGNKPDLTFTMTKTAPGSSILLSTTPSPSQNSATSSVVKTNRVSSALKHQPERYLPPSGPYYDQFRLSDIFGTGFFNEKCVICWGSPHVSSNGSECAGVCAICGTTDHRNESCPLLYCTQDWYTAPHFPHGFASVHTGQFRPTRTEISTLRQLGLIEASGGFNSPIVPNTRHSLVQEFYRNKVHPNMMWFRLTSNNATPRPDSTPSQSSSEVNSDLDPQLQSLSTTTNLLSIKSNMTMAPTLVQAKEFVSDSKQACGAEAEQMIQKLEDEVLRLKTENIAKDREIRKLKSEVEQSRSNNYETGSKRLCM